jgi:hypothetical protein
MLPAELDLDSIPRRARPKKTVLDRPRRGAVWRRIVRSLRLDGAQTERALATNLNETPMIIGYLIDWYVKHGIVEREGRRKWRLTAKGMDYGKPRPQKPRPKKPTSWSRVTSDEELIGV